MMSEGLRPGDIKERCELKRPGIITKTNLARSIIELPQNLGLFFL